MVKILDNAEILDASQACSPDSVAQRKNLGNSFDSNPKSKTKSSVKDDQDLLKQSLRTGCFDACVSLLRTCSEPDLTQLGRTPMLKRTVTAGSNDDIRIVTDTDSLSDEDEKIEVVALYNYYKQVSLCYGTLVFKLASS